MSKGTVTDMKVILCTGDSHCWGQGASGQLEELHPAAVPGDLRLASFALPNYVNLLRRMVHQKTGSSAAEWRIPDGALCLSPSRPLTLQGDMELIRVQLLAQNALSEVQLLVDGEVYDSFSLTREDCTNAVVTRYLHPKAGEHVLTVRASKGTVLLFRVEMYRGPFAVVNSGIGSCPSGRFLDVYWSERVSALKPFAAIVEPHSINDWVNKQTPQQTEQTLNAMIDRFSAEACRTLMLTVSPILGPQSLPLNENHYVEFVEASRRVARQRGIPLCDANAAMLQRMQGLSCDEQRALLFDDDWHVNNLGHQIYAQTAWDGLCHAGILDPKS